jgi:hypothetical protein
MNIAEKYGVTEENWKKMIADGLLACSIPKHEGVYNTFQKGIQAGLSKPQAIANAAEEFRLSERMVYFIIKKF